TERRKKWSSVDLTKYNKTEERILKSMDLPTTVNFFEEQLEDAIKYLQEYHNLPLWIDKQALQDEGISLDQAVTLQLDGVKFRSVLKLLFEPFQLTWLIEDEVMKITTVNKAADKLQIRVYPVADLVIPIQRLGGGGIGGGGGGAIGGGFHPVGAGTIG